MVFGNQVLFDLFIQLWRSSSFLSFGANGSATSFFHQTFGSFFQIYAFPPLYCIFVICFLSFTYIPILSYSFSISHMVFSHIHYNTYFEFCTILLLYCSFFCHKNMHLQKCLTFGVHIMWFPGIVVFYFSDQNAKYFLSIFFILPFITVRVFTASCFSSSVPYIACFMSLPSSKQASSWMGK